MLDWSSPETSSAVKSLRSPPQLWKLISQDPPFSRMRRNCPLPRIMCRNSRLLILHITPNRINNHYLTLLVLPRGQALGYSVRSTIPAPRENVAVQALGNLLCPAKQGCRLLVLSFLPHHHHIGTGHIYLIALKTINMPPSKPPVQNPVDIPFENGII